MSEKCWEINPKCVAKSSPEFKCPAYKTDKSCYEIDWTPRFKKVAPDMKKMILEYMIDECPKCPVYPDNKEKVDRLIAEIKTF